MNYNESRVHTVLHHLGSFHLSYAHDFNLTSIFSCRENVIFHITNGNNQLRYI